MALNYVGETCCMLKITIPPGSKVIDIGNISYFQEEQEVIINNEFGSLLITGKPYKENNIKTCDVLYVPHNSKKLTITNIKK